MYISGLVGCIATRYSIMKGGEILMIEGQVIEITSKIGDKGHVYVVTKLVNRLKPLINTVLSESEIRTLIIESKAKVIIKGW